MKVMNKIILIQLRIQQYERRIVVWDGLFTVMLKNLYFKFKSKTKEIIF